MTRFRRRGIRMKGYNFAYLDEQTKRMIRRALLKAVAIPGHQVPFGSREMPLPYGWGTGGIQVTASVLGAERYAESDRPGRRRYHQRGLDPAFLRAHRRRAHHHAHRRGDRHPDPPSHPGSNAAREPDHRLPGAAAGTAVSPGTQPGRNETHARAVGLWADACEALRGHRPVGADFDQLRLSGHGQRALSDVAQSRSRRSTIRR